MKRGYEKIVYFQNIIINSRMNMFFLHFDYETGL